MKKEKLTAAQQNSLYSKWLTGGFTLYQLSQEYNVTQSTVSIIISKQLNNRKNSKE